MFFFAAVQLAQSAITWDAGAGTQWWFDPVNWNTGTQTNMVLPPNQGDNTAIDAQINIGTAGLPGGEGVVYDPVNDPNFGSAASRTYPTGASAAFVSAVGRDYGPQTLFRFYVSRNTTNTNLVTIKSGDLAIEGTTIIGRSGSASTSQNLGRVNQLGGLVRLPLIALDMGNREASGWGNGTWDYRGGTLEVSLNGGNGLRLSAGSSSGPGGVGRFIMHNPNTSGHVRAFDFRVADNDGGSSGILPDGLSTGVGIVEFHYENGGTRPIQVSRNLVLNNGSTSTGAVRSARLDIVLDAAPSVSNGIPQDLGLFDVAFSDATGAITGTGDLNGDMDFANDQVFSNANAANPLDVSAAYYQDSIVSAIFGGTKYNWKISYTGMITWSDAANSVVQSIAEAGGTDVVLIGFSTESVGVPGDYNNNGVVDGADYVVWRNGGPLQNEVDMPGTVNAADYTAWRARFGNASGAGSGLNSSAVPEPQWFLLALLSVSWINLSRRGR